MRDFVRNILPQVRARSPQPLNLHTERDLEKEIENEYATVVGGDGCETMVGMDGVKGELSVEKNVDIQTLDEPASKEYPSWGRTRGWPLVTSLLSSQDMVEEHLHDDGSGEENIDRPPSTDVQSQPRAHISHPAHEIRRARSAISLVSVPNPRKPSSLASRRAGPSSIRLPAKMSTISTPPPSPLLRRSNLSHPDIASLVENWTHTGPANETLLYRTQPSSS